MKSFFIPLYYREGVRGIAGVALATPFFSFYFINLSKKILKIVLKMLLNYYYYWYIMYIYLYIHTYYDDFKVYGKKIYIKRSCSLVFCHHFLYYKLPEIVLPKHGILLFKLTKILWHLLWRVFWWSGADRRIKTNNF